jgi:hypothetical protein
MDIFTGLHAVLGGSALITGAAAAVAQKGGRLHRQAGAAFAAAMLGLGTTASVLERQQGDSGMGGVFVAYFVVTAWLAARRREGTGRAPEIACCAVALGAGAVTGWAALTGAAPTTPAGPGPVLAIALLCLAAGLADLKAVLRPLTTAQRISRHLWRMCFAFFIATGSFFLGQQDVMPQAVQGSPFLFLLALAPFGLMAYGLARTGGRRGRPQADREAASP